MIRFISMTSTKIEYHDFTHCEIASIVLNELELNNICFSDEATSHLNGCVNKHNRFMYAMHNPKMVA